jgi:3'(2'), 5'-bisphosphate nucleotidase
VTVVSEEAFAGAAAPLPHRFFLVDPLDGTKEFINKRSDFTVNIALVEGVRPRFGLVYAPARALLAVTLEDGKAVAAELPPNEAGADIGRLAMKPLQARPVRAAGLTALVSHSHLDAETEAFLATLDVAERSGIGSSVKFLAIAKGEADVYPRFGPTMEWDTAAGQAVLEAAGGRVVGTDGEPLRYGKVETGLRNPSFIAWGRTSA